MYVELDDIRNAISLIKDKISSLELSDELHLSIEDFEAKFEKERKELLRQ